MPNLTLINESDRTTDLMVPPQAGLRPAISVIVPVFNEETAIAEDLRLIASTMQAYGQPFEVIVVDDGSTDRSCEIVTKFPEVRLLRHPYNQGTGAALKTGIRAARGDIIVMTDGDGTYPAAT